MLLAHINGERKQKSTPVRGYPVRGFPRRHNGRGNPNCQKQFRLRLSYHSITVLSIRICLYFFPVYRDHRAKISLCAFSSSRLFQNNFQKDLDKMIFKWYSIQKSYERGLSQMKQNQIQAATMRMLCSRTNTVRVFCACLFGSKSV